MSIHQTNISGPAQMLRALRGQLEKAETHALAVGYEAGNLLAARLAPDLHPLARQIQFVCTQAREVVCDWAVRHWHRCGNPTIWMRRVRLSIRHWSTWPPPTRR